MYALEIGPLILAFNEVEKVEMNPANSISPLDIMAIAEVKRSYFIPCQHFGLFHLKTGEFEQIVRRLQTLEARFLLEPTIVNRGTLQEQLLTFACDPQGYVMEIRASNVQRGFQASEFEQQSTRNTKEVQERTLKLLKGAVKALFQATYLS